MPLPASFGRGFGEKSATSPFRATIVSTTERNVMALSAAESGSE